MRKVDILQENRRRQSGPAAVAARTFWYLVLVDECRQPLLSGRLLLRSAPSLNNPNAFFQNPNASSVSVFPCSAGARKSPRTHGNGEDRGRDRVHGA